MASTQIDRLGPSPVGPWPTVLQFPGVDPTGAVDSTAAFQNALNATTGGILYVPPGIYRVGALNQNGQVLRGAGRFVTTLLGSSAIESVLNIENNTYEVSDLTIDCAVTPTGGAGITTADGAYGDISRVNVQNTYVGIIAGPTARSTMTDVACQKCFVDGFQFATSASNAAAQWIVTRGLAQFNSGHGVSLFANGSVANPLNQTGPDFDNFGCYQNGQGGAIISGASGTAWNDMTWRRFYSSFDNGPGIEFDNVGQNNELIDPFCEWTGHSAAGRAGSVVASNVGAGIVVESAGEAASNLKIVGGTMQFCSYQGFVVSNSMLGLLSLVGLFAFDNGQAGATHGIGIDIQGSASLITTLTGCHSANRGSNTTQKYGMHMSYPANIFAAACNFAGNATAAVNTAILGGTAANNGA